MHRRLLITMLAGTLAVLGTSVLTTPAQASQPLRDHASARGFLIGAAVATGPLANEPAYRDTLNREFNAVTAENAMKWDATEPSQGQFNFSGADQIMSSAQANNQTVHGHTLVWHSQTPGWVQNLDAAAMRAAMQNHISTVVGRYAGRIRSWDVVNEVFEENGSLRNSFWLQRLGESYIADAFRYARAADPNATLCINDYNIEGQNDKSNAMYNLVNRLRGQGVPIDCVGIQGHLAIQYGFPNDLQANIQRFADLGVEVKITELDVRMQLPADAGKLATQATYYRNVVQACLAVSRCTGVTIWGFTDRYSWVPDTFPGQGAALPYDENYNPKPAYTAIHDLLAGSGGGGDGGCQVAYQANGWGASFGFTAAVTITNTGSAPVDNWTLEFAFTAGQRVTEGWSATWSQPTDSQHVTATAMTWNSTIAPNGSVGIGFNGSHTGTNPAPTTFILNDTPCETA